MKVFISWSGDRGKQIGAAFRSWLPDVIQAVEPFYSPDIEKGERWSKEIAQGLRESKVGIICVTPESMLSPWLIFESGAISNAELTKVCPLIFELDTGQLQGPLNQFQVTPFNEDEIRKLVSAINFLIPAPLTESQLDRNFERLWPELLSAVEKALAVPSVAEKPKKRSTDDMLEEVLATIRIIANNNIGQAFDAQKFEDSINHWIVSFRGMVDYGIAVEDILVSSKTPLTDVVTATINHLRLMLNLIQPKISKSKKYAQFQTEANHVMTELELVKDVVQGR